MKKYLWSILLAIFTVTLCAACGDDNGEEEITGGGNTGTGEWKAGITETDNTITFSYQTGTGGYTVKYKEVYTFENDKCVRLDFTITYPSKQLADYAMTEIKSDPEYATYFKNLKQNGSSITYTEPSMGMEGFTKAQIREALELRLAAMKGTEA